MKVASGVATASQSNEKRTLTDTSSGPASGLKGASISKEAFEFEDGSASHGSTIPAAPVHSNSSDEAYSAHSTQSPLINVLASVADQPYRWCVQGQYQFYRDAKMIKIKGS